MRCASMRFSDCSSLQNQNRSRVYVHVEHLEPAGRLLSCTLIYRALLDSILARGTSKAYGHGVRYLKRLDTLASDVTDWGSFPTHQTYLESLPKKHGLKVSFWSRY